MRWSGPCPRAGRAQAAVDGLGLAIAQPDFVSDELADGRLIMPFDLPLRTKNGYFVTRASERRLPPAEFGVRSLDEVVPIESPPALRERQAGDRRAANRTFYWTTRFRWEAATQRIRWTTEDFHRHAPDTVLTSSLVADHPFFGVSGLGMGMDRESTTWGGWPLTLDWFGLARERALDVAAIEDWLGLQFMFGPAATWDGFQLIGWQAAIFSRFPMP